MGSGVLIVENRSITSIVLRVLSRPAGDAHMRLRASILLPFLIGLSLVTVAAQTAVTLQPGVPVERNLSTGQVHEFTVNAKENSLVQLVVQQKGIDVVIKIASPGGQALSEQDTPN